jgi:hypothetical protein
VALIPMMRARDAPGIARKMRAFIRRVTRPVVQPTVLRVRQAKTRRGIPDTVGKSPWHEIMTGTKLATI